MSHFDDAKKRGGPRGIDLYIKPGVSERGVMDGGSRSPSPRRTPVAGLGDKRPSEAEKLQLGIHVAFELMQ